MSKTKDPTDTPEVSPATPGTKTLAEYRAEATAAKAAEEKAKTARDEREELHLFEHFGSDWETRYVVEHLSDTPSSLPGIAVMRPYTPQEFRALQSQIKAKKTDIEAVFRRDVARLMIYPPAEIWEQAMDAHPGLYQDCSKALVARANGEKKGA